MSALLNFYDPNEAVEDNFAELKALKIWLCWCFCEKEGRKTKIPVAASGGKTGTNEAYRHTLVSFDEAQAAARSRGYSGVGFVVPKGWFFLDIDHRAEDDPFVAEMLNRFGSYAERSISGEGFHIYGRCELDRLPTESAGEGRRRLSSRYYQKNPNNGVELYFGGLTNRFAVFTGNAVRDVPLCDCTEAVLQTLEKDMQRGNSLSYNKRENNNKAIGKINLNEKQNTKLNDDVISGLRAQKNGGKFSRLFDVGDISGYGSHSEADLALCSMIAFRTGGDVAETDRIFRQSALYRKKWERADYRAETLRKAAENVRPWNSDKYNIAQSELYNIAENGRGEKGGSEAQNCPGFVRFNEQSGKPYVVVPLLAQYVREHLQYLLVRDDGRQGLLKYVYENGVYKLCADEMFKGYIKRFVEDFDPELVKIKQINEAFQHIITDCNYISQNELNSREDIINFRNGLLVVSAGELRLEPHTPSVYSTIQIPCDWTGKRQETPVFSQYLKTLTDGDKDIARLLLQYIGACLSNICGWRMKKSLFLVGSGDTGKSQLKSLVERLLGKGNFIGTDLSEIESRFGTGNIYGTRLAGSSDMSFMTVSELKTFKKITGGDSLFAEFKGQPGFEFTYGGLLWFCMNRLPRFGGDDGKWVYDRIMVVNCPNVIPPEAQDKLLNDKMFAEREGIIYLAVKALQRVIQNGCRFDEPESVTKARAEYIARNNTVISFFDECMTKRPGGKIRDKATTGRVYKVYREWCRENNGGFAKTAREFRETLAEYLGTTFEEMTKRTNGNNFYSEYTLSLEAKQQYATVYGFDDSYISDSENTE